MDSREQATVSLHYKTPAVCFPQAAKQRQKQDNRQILTTSFVNSKACSLICYSISEGIFKSRSFWQRNIVQILKSLNSRCLQDLHFHPDQEDIHWYQFQGFFLAQGLTQGIKQRLSYMSPKVNQNEEPKQRNLASEFLFQTQKSSQSRKDS